MACAQCAGEDRGIYSALSAREEWLNHIYRGRRNKFRAPGALSLESANSSRANGSNRLLTIPVQNRLPATIRGGIDVFLSVIDVEQLRAAAANHTLSSF